MVVCIAPKQVLLSVKVAPGSIAQALDVSAGCGNGIRAGFGNDESRGLQSPGAAMTSVGRGERIESTVR